MNYIKVDGEFFTAYTEIGFNLFNRIPRSINALEKFSLSFLFLPSERMTILNPNFPSEAAKIPHRKETEFA